jgi:hypothetical protein
MYGSKSCKQNSDHLVSLCDDPRSGVHGFAGAPFARSLLSADDLRDRGGQASQGSVEQEANSIGLSACLRKYRDASQNTNGRCAPGHGVGPASLPARNSPPPRRPAPPMKRTSPRLQALPVLNLLSRGESHSL